ncbi:MAG: glycosyltransferase [Chloroflexota bacterium]
MAVDAAAGPIESAGLHADDSVTDRADDFEQPALVVAYVMSRFPKLSETFVVNEILAVERAGVRVSLHPLIRHRESRVQPDAARLMPRAHFVGIGSGEAIRAVAAWLRERPRQLVGCVADLIAETWRRPGRLARTLILLPTIAAQARLIRAEGAAHVHCHFATYPAFAGLVIHRLTGIPFSFTAHAHDIHMDETMLARKVREASFVVAISEDNRRRLTSTAPAADDGAGDAAAKIHVIHCGVDTARFAPGRRREAAPGVARSDGADALNILSIGRLMELKGHADLIAACALLRAAGVAFRCTIVGDGPLRGELQASVANAGLEGLVTLTGPQTSDEVLERLAAADVLAAPSRPDHEGRMEGIPVVLMEAMSAGLPVVASRMTGVPELVADGETGLLTEPGDVAELTAALHRLADDPALRDRLGIAGRARVQEQFELWTQGELLADAFRESAAAASTGRHGPVGVRARSVPSRRVA